MDALGSLGTSNAIISPSSLTSASTAASKGARPSGALGVAIRTQVRRAKLTLLLLLTGQGADVRRAGDDGPSPRLSRALVGLIVVRDDIAIAATTQVQHRVCKAFATGLLEQNRNTIQGFETRGRGRELINQSQKGAAIGPLAIAIAIMVVALLEERNGTEPVEAQAGPRFEDPYFCAPASAHDPADQNRFFASSSLLFFSCAQGLGCKQEETSQMSKASTYTPPPTTTTKKTKTASKRVRLTPR